MKERLRQSMLGRYGNDNLNRLLTVLSVIMMLVSMFTRLTAFYLIALVLLGLGFFRIFSRNIVSRRRENNEFLRLRGKVIHWFTNLKDRFSQRKTHAFFKCPSCKAQLRVPKGRGRISVTCPKCRTVFEKRT